jgi:hypothetical protein
MRPPKCIKNIQKLTGCMAALSQFISRLGEKGLPFFKLLKEKEKFKWLEEADTAFVELKQFLTCPPVLTAPKEGETLLLYIAATNRVVSTAIVVKREEVGHVYKVQRLIYFISEVFIEPKACYSLVQKLLYAVLITSRKLHHYFDTYPIELVTEFPLGDILCNKDVNGHIIKWALELSP